MVRIVLTVLCSLGMVAMHQLTAQAMPEHAATVSSHQMAGMGQTFDHNCAGGGTVAATTPEACSAHQACQAVPGSARTAPTPPTTPIAASSNAPTTAAAVTRAGWLHASGDPPDLFVLSVSRT